MMFRGPISARVVIRLFLFLCLLPLLAGGCGEPAKEADRETAEPEAAPAPDSPPAPRPNIIIVVIDTLRQDALRTYNKEAQSLDALDAFSERAAVFENALAPSSWTLPSLASLLTGMYPDRHGAAHPRLALPERFATIGTAAHEEGYETIAFTDGVYVSPPFGVARGFDWFNDTAGPDARPMPDLPRGGEPHPESGTEMFDRGLHYLRARSPGDKPFLLLLHTYSVHDYFRAHPWAVAEVPEAANMDANAIYCLISREFCTEGIWPQFRALYDAEVRHMNAAFGELMTTLEELGLADSTYVLFTADHGEGFEPENQRVHHGGRLDLDVIRVPLLIAGPGIAARRIAEPVSLVDVMPTVLDVLGSAAPDTVEGVSLLPRIAGAPIPPRPIFALEYFYWWQDGVRRDVQSIAVFPLAEAVLSDGRWYTRHQSRASITDLLPGRTPVAQADLPALAAEMGQILRERDTRLHPGDSREEDAELQEKLRSLGYVN
jgi:arylsulfatase A-like enzyme